MVDLEASRQRALRIDDLDKCPNRGRISIYLDFAMDSHEVVHRVQSGTP